VWHLPALSSPACAICSRHTEALALGRESPDLNKVEWRFNNRKNQFRFRDTMLKLIASSNLEYKNLTANQSAA
jgi:hypothetical protein